MLDVGCGSSHDIGGSDVYRGTALLHRVAAPIYGTHRLVSGTCDLVSVVPLDLARGRVVDESAVIGRCREGSTVAMALDDLDDDSLSVEFALKRVSELIAPITCPTGGLDMHLDLSLSAERHDGTVRDLLRTPGTLPLVLASTLLGEFGLRAETVERVPGGFDPAAALWRIVDEGGRGWAVKTTQRDCRYGLALAAAVSRDGFPGVVPPRLTRARIPWSLTGKSLVSVSHWIEGDDAMTVGLSPGQWGEVGKILRFLHEYRPPRSIAPVRRGIKRIGQDARDRFKKLDRYFAALSLQKNADGYSEAHHLTDLWHEHRSRFTRLDKMARELKALRTPAPRVPCHGDPHLGNVLLDEHGHPWLIDFDEATTAHREIDMVLIELGVLPRRPILLADRHAFWSGYGAFDLDETRLTRFGCVRALEDVTSVFRALTKSSDVAERNALNATLYDLLGPKGLIALVEGRLGD